MVDSQGSTIVGFDAQLVQPKLTILDKSLSCRLKWIHGNMCGFYLPDPDIAFSCHSVRLDGLPFREGQFNFVRMVRMGLHIPEDEVSVLVASHCFADKLFRDR